jgi:RHS repeat-associated protein
VEQASTSAAYWFVHDQIGSTVGLLDKTGAEVTSYTYTEYGAATQSGTVGTPLLFTGQYTDAESGLVFLRARYYDPGTAEFLTVDPLVDKTGAAYIYAGNSPLNSVDLSGLDWWNPTTWTAKTWVAVGTGALIVGSVALDVASLGTATPELVGLDSAVIASEGASSAAQAARLAASLASEQQMTEEGVTMAGGTAKTVLRAASRLADEYGGQAAEWVKKTSSEFTRSDGFRIQTHWYESIITGCRVEQKTKILDPK